MSDTVASALKFAGAVILSIVLLGIGIMLFSPAADSAKGVQSDFASNTTELKDQKYLIYDNTVVSGSQVISALRKFEAEGKDGSLAVKVRTGKNTAGTWYYSSFEGKVLTAGAGANSIANTSTVTSIDYINPAGMFDAVVQRDANHVIRAIVFTQNVTN